MSVAFNPKFTEETTSGIQFPELKFTGNNLEDVIETIKQGNIVALHALSEFRVFHNISNVDLSKRRVVYLDCTSDPRLLCEGEWEYYIRQEIPSVKELEKGDSLRTRIIEEDIPHKTYRGG